MLVQNTTRLFLIVAGITLSVIGVIVIKVCITQAHSFHRAGKHTGMQLRHLVPLTAHMPHIAGHPQWWRTPAAPNHPTGAFSGCCSNMCLKAAPLTAGIAAAAAGIKASSTCCTGCSLAGVTSTSTCLAHASDIAAGWSTAFNSIRIAVITEAAGNGFAGIAETVAVFAFASKARSAST
jgi:hypothetical protein